MERQSVECPECGENFTEEKYLEEHFDVEHPDTELDLEQEQNLNLELPEFKKSFRNGVLLGVLLTAGVLAAFYGYQAYSYDPVDVTVVSCENCTYERFKGATERYFDVRYEEVNYESERGQELIEKYGLSYVPGFIFEKEIEERSNFTRVRNALIENEDGYVMSDTRNEAAQRFSKGFSLE